MNDTLLFLHVLSAFLLAASVVCLSAVAIGAAVNERTVSLGNLLWDVGGLGTLVFGVWLALRIDGYEITDGWILGAIVLWFVATGVAVGARRELQPATAAPAPDQEAAATSPGWTARGVALHWVRAAIVVAFLVLMIWKPGA